MVSVPYPSAYAAAQNASLTPFHSEEKPKSSQRPSGPMLPGWCYLCKLTSSDCHRLSCCSPVTVASPLVSAQKKLFITALSARRAIPPVTHEVGSLTLQDCSQFMFLSWMRAVCMLSCFSVSDSVRLHGWYPARPLCPWDSPGKNTGVDCHAFSPGIIPTQG